MKTSTYDEPYEEEPSSQDDEASITSASTFQEECHESLFTKVTPHYYHVTEPPPVPKRFIPQCDDSTNVEPNITPIKPPRYESPVVEIPEVAAVECSELAEVEYTESIEVDVQSGYRDIEIVSPEEVIQKTEGYSMERWSDTTSVALPGQTEDIETVTSDTDPADQANAQCEPISEMYYTASSEVSLLSDTEPEKAQNDDEDKEKDDRKSVIAGHVAAMRERFESMTRTNTPCPDLIRSLSPSLEVFRNTSPSPDRLA